MRLFHVAIALTLLAIVGFADSVTLKSGRVISGTYLGGSPRQVRMDMGDHIETLDVADISRIEFGPVTPAINDRPMNDRPSMRRSDNDRPVLRRADNSDPVIMRPDPAQEAPPPPPRDPVELPAGTNLVIRMIDGVDSETAHTGQTFAGSLDEPVQVAGNMVIPRGADVILKLVDAKESGKLTGRAELTLDLVSIKVGGKMVDVNTQTVSRESDSRGARTAKVAGGTAAVGAIIGAIAGGGKGAAIGAAAGGAAGAGAEVVTKGQRVKIPSETRLTFVLDTPVRV
jgi:hypothetical protein